MSDLLHELCSSHIDFHPTLKKTQPSANCLRDTVEVTKGQNVLEKKRKEKKKKALRDFEMSCPAPLGGQVMPSEPQSVTAAETKN